MATPSQPPGPDSLRFAVLGVGAVGGTIAALLARAGNPVLCLTRPGTGAALEAAGLRLTTRYESFVAPVATAWRLPERWLREGDVLIVATKATDLAAALDRVPAAATPGRVVLPLLNGIDHVSLLRRRWPLAHVVPATISAEAARDAPGNVRLRSAAASVCLSSPTGAPVEPLYWTLLRAGLDTTIEQDETALLWRKLALLAPLALLGAATGASVGELRTRHRQALHVLVEEACTVARAAGGDARVQATMTAVDRLSPDMKTSMQRDAEAGRPLELDEIGGAVLRAAARTGTPTPATADTVQRLANRPPGEPTQAAAADGGARRGTTT